MTQTGRHGIVYGKGGMVPRHKDGTNPLLRKRQRGLAFSVGNMNGFSAIGCLPFFRWSLLYHLLPQPSIQLIPK